MKKMFTVERNTLMLMSLLKAHSIKKVIASPGATNVCFIASLQHDPYFEIYSSVDERSAAYMACGLAAESGEPVVLSCTGATASRNYAPGLTEAFYSKLPILAVTSTQHIGKIGQNVPQMIDRTARMNDLVKCSVQIPMIHSKEDDWACNLALNNALLELRHRGGGPVHINLATDYSDCFDVTELPTCRVIYRYEYKDSLPKLQAEKVGIFVGAHKKWDEALTKVVDRFCEFYNGVVFCDHTSNYHGKYGVQPAIVTYQSNYNSPYKVFDVMIYIGDISGAYTWLQPKEVWRVNPDGEIRDNYKLTTKVFEMEEIYFFQSYADSSAKKTGKKPEFYNEWVNECHRIRAKLPEFPFSNIWIAQHTLSRLPENSTLYLGILNSLRAWNFFEKPANVDGYSNTGGFGIDGIISSLLGASLSNSEKLFFVIVGDLAFFYDMNVIGNRHIGKNMRILLINNGRGTEFHNYNHPAAAFGKETDWYMAAAGHFGNQSKKLVKHYALDLGYEYLCASNKEEYLKEVEKFLFPQITNKPMLFEVFTDSDDESNALKMVNEIETLNLNTMKKAVKKMIGKKGTDIIKKFVERQR